MVLTSTPAVITGRQTETATGRMLCRREERYAARAAESEAAAREILRIPASRRR